MCHYIFHFTEEYWDTLSRSDLFAGKRYEYDDQARINFGLNKLNITWKADAQKLHSGNIAVGVCQNYLTVTVLPPTMICRKCSENQKNSYYIWHHNSLKNQHQKIITAQKINTWLLQKNWRKKLRASSLKGTDWLVDISSAKKHPLAT